MGEGRGGNDRGDKIEMGEREGERETVRESDRRVREGRGKRRQRESITSHPTHNMFPHTKHIIHV